MTGNGFAPVPPPPLSTKEGWREWTNRQIGDPPELPSLRRRENMSSRERMRFDILRRWHHKSFGPAETALMRPILDAIVERATGNIGSVPGACPGIVIDGKPAVGKSTTATHGGRLYEIELRELFGPEVREWSEAEYIPVVYHSLDTPATVKNLNRGIIQFYGGVVSSRDGTSQLTDLVVWHVQKCKTTLIVIDDVHYLDKNKQSTEEVNDHLKMLMNETSATFVYAGVGCEKTKLLTEGRPETEDENHLAQTRRRFSLHMLEPFKTDTKEDRANWGKLLNTFEKNLVLRNAEAGMLANEDMAWYLHDRTGGFIGTLATLLRDGASRAIKTGIERITVDLLEEITVDQAAAKEYPVRRNRRKRR